MAALCLPAIRGSYALRPAAGQALGDCDGGPGSGDQGVQGDRHRRAGQAGFGKLRYLMTLALVLAAAGLARAGAPAAPDRRLAEVVQPGVPAAASRVERLLGITDVAAGEVADGRDRAVPEPDGGVQLAVLLARHRVDLGRQAVGPPAERVQEVAALADEARALKVGVGV